MSPIANIAIVTIVYDIRQKSPRILVIRRDNIGDLVCTTPLIGAVRQRFPHAWIGALVNSYNAPVLDGNTDLDGVFVYTKAKHRARHENLFGIFWRRCLMMRSLRAMALDDVIVATTSPQRRVVKLARWLKPKRTIAFGDSGADVELPCTPNSLHEVEDMFRVVSLYGIQGTPPAAHVPSGAVRDPLTVAIHISARKPSQRWAADNFIALMRELHAQNSSLHFVLLWSPGKSDDPRHPGDDHKAMKITEALGKSFPVTAAATHELSTLIAALAKCGSMICADGGAMHLGAGLGLPIVALFGDSSIERWRPWRVPQRILQTASRNVADIQVSEVVAAFNALRADTREPNA